jgi:hypothetical protein
MARAALEAHAETALDALLLGSRCIPVADPVIEHPAAGRRLEADQVAQQGAFAAAAATHDNEHIAAAYGEAEIALDDEITVGHGQVLHRDVCRRCRFRGGLCAHIRYPAAGTGW